MLQDEIIVVFPISPFFWQVTSVSTFWASHSYVKSVLWHTDDIFSHLLLSLPTDFFRPFAKLMTGTVERTMAIPVTMINGYSNLIPYLLTHSKTTGIFFQAKLHSLEFSNYLVEFSNTFL